MGGETGAVTQTELQGADSERFESSDSKEYCVDFSDDDVTSFVAYVAGTEDSLYRHKFIKLKFEIPENYPLVPPKVTFVQHSGGRIHPNLYTEGKVCLSILGTWAGEQWSLLDNKPYLHEPGQRDNPKYNDYVRYATWQYLLLDYLQYEDRPKLRNFMLQYLQNNGQRILQDFGDQSRQHASPQYFRSNYGGRTIKADYPALMKKLKEHVLSAEEDRKTNNVQQVGADTNLHPEQVRSQDPPIIKTTSLTTCQPGAEQSSLKRKSTQCDDEKKQPIDLDAEEPKKRKTHIIDLT
ncbi:MAG: hypothetical protein Q9159_003474 [Coniocarpon cinnabarinum]